MGQIRSLIDNAKKIIHSNHTISIIFLEEKSAKLFQGELMKVEVCNVLGQQKKVDVLSRSDSLDDIDYPEYTISFTRDEYDKLMGENAFELLREQNISSSKSEEQEKKPYDDRNYEMMGPKN